MRSLPITSLFLLALSNSAAAEVFSCQQADGTTAFSYVPCRIERPAPTQANTDIEVALTQTSPQSEEFTARDYKADISTLEAELDQLHTAREKEIAAAPFSTTNPDLLNDLKAQIRANYQTRIDENLRELVQLRAEQKNLR